MQYVSTADWFLFIAITKCTERFRFPLPARFHGSIMHPQMMLCLWVFGGSASTHRNQEILFKDLFCMGVVFRLDKLWKWITYQIHTNPPIANPFQLLSSLFHSIQSLVSRALIFTGLTGFKLHIPTRKSLWVFFLSSIKPCACSEDQAWQIDIFNLFALKNGF